jgi:hypothetical protein
MGSELVDVEWVLTELTRAGWHLDRAAGSSPEAARLDMQATRQIYESVLGRLHHVRGDLEQIGQVHTKLTELANRLHALEGDDLQLE